MLLASVTLNVNVEVCLLVNEAATALLTLDALLIRYSFFSAVFEAGGCQSEVTLLRGHLLIKSLGQGHLTTLAHANGC